MIPSDSQYSLFSSATCASDLSIFEQHLPQEPRRFHIELQKGKAHRRLIAFRSHGSYDFTVHPQGKSPRSRADSPPGLSSTLDACPEYDELQDEHFALNSQRTFFRHQRLDHFIAGRQFPALMSPKVLPSFKRVTNDLKRNLVPTLPSLGPEEVPTLPSLVPESEEKESVKMTVSVLRHRQANERRFKVSKSRHNILPFIPGGIRHKSIPHGRRSGPVHDNYDTAKEALKMEMRLSKTKQLNGAFLPSSSKSKRKALGPLVFCRSQLSSATPVNWCLRSRPATFPQEFTRATETENAGQEVSDSHPTVLTGDTPDPKSRCNSKSRYNSDARSRINSGGDTPGGKSSVCGSRTGSKRCVEEGPAETSSMGGIPIFAKQVDEASLEFQSKKQEAEKERAQEKDSAFTLWFRKISDEGKVHRDDVLKALTSLGFANPKMAWIDEAFEEVSKYVSIGLEDFLRFLTHYKALQLAYYKKEFEQCDLDGSGSVECAELSGLMNKLGILPMKHVLDQVVAEVDENGNGELDFAEFEAVMDILRRREGFAKEEYDEISTLFSRFDSDASGSMNTKEVHIALKWLGFSFKDEEADAIIREVDEDGSGQIDQIEWFVCMRKVREAKIKRLREVIAGCDENNDGAIQYSELQTLLRALGYVPDFDAVYEAAEAAGIMPDDEDLDLGELWRLLAVYREREGLNTEDLEQVAAAFTKYAKAEGEGDEVEADVLDIGKMLRAMGYVVDFEQQQCLTAKVDIDSSGKLDRREFRKMVRMIHDKDVELFRTAFNDACEDLMAEVVRKLSTGRSGTLLKYKSGGLRHGSVSGAIGQHLTVQQALHALESVSCTDSPAVLQTFFAEDAQADGRIDFYEFCQAAIRSRRNARVALRNGGGFTEDEVSDLRMVFINYDSDGGGQLSGIESIKLFETEFPSISNDPSRRLELVRLLKEADEDGNGKLDFGDFLRIMRNLRDIEDQLRVSKELAAVSTTKFTANEVQEFRELFLSAGEGMMELGFNEVKELLKCIVPMGTKNVEDLRRKFGEHAAKQCGNLAGHVDQLDFPEFLCFMRALLDMNFAHMFEKADKMVGDGTTPSGS